MRVTPDRPVGSIRGTMFYDEGVSLMRSATCGSDDHLFDG